MKKYKLLIVLFVALFSCNCFSQNNSSLNINVKIKSININKTIDGFSNNLKTCFPKNIKKQELDYKPINL
jgi:hypothetical protein